ncbi:hypothetical protein L9F63_023328, partial [Diploptera punctata]
IKYFWIRIAWCDQLQGSFKMTYNQTSVSVDEKVWSRYIKYGFIASSCKQKWQRFQIWNSFILPVVVDCSFRAISPSS